MEIRFARTDDNRLAEMAPAHWREKAAEKRFEREKRQELVAGGLLADTLASFLGRTSLDDLEDLANLEVLETAAGKPCLSNFPEAHFSLSHSDEVVMCVVSDRPVGCDVEKIAPLDDDLKREVGSIAAWTLREAAFKCGDPAATARPVSAPDGYAAAVAFRDRF